MLPTSSRPGRESYGRNDVRAKKNTPRCCACVKSPRTKNEPHRVTRCKSRSPDLGNRIPMISRRKNSPALPTSAPSTRPPSRPVPPSSGHTTRRRKSSATPSKARTHIFVHDGLSSGVDDCPFARQHRTKRCSGGTGQARRQTGERRRAEISRVVLLWRRLSAFSFWRTKRRLSGDFLPKHGGRDAWKASPFVASMAICWARGT